MLIFRIKPSEGDPMKCRHCEVQLSGRYREVQIDGAVYHFCHDRYSPDKEDCVTKFLRKYGGAQQQFREFLAVP